MKDQAHSRAVRLFAGFRTTNRQQWTAASQPASCRKSLLRVLVCVLGLLSFATPSFAERIPTAQIEVVDGDTIKIDGFSIRLLDLDTPETFRPECEYERQLGRMATARLEGLIATFDYVDIQMLPGRDKYQRGLGRLTVAGSDYARLMIAEGLARAYDGGRRTSWCRQG